MQEWWRKAVVYQVYPRSFKDSNGDGNGDIPGIIEKLDYLKKLGVDALWLSPVYQSPMVDNGYDISDYEAIDPMFGTMDDFDRLVSSAKARGIRIIMDLVVNHTSDQHHWFQAARQSRENPMRDFYIWRDTPVGNPKNWAFDALTGQYYYHLFSPQQPDLNWENPQVRKAVHQMMRFWLDKGISGFRLDVIDLIGKVPDEGITVNGPKLHDYLQEMNAQAFGGRELLTVGEAWSSSPELAKLYSAPERKELSMVFGFWHILTSAGNGDKWQYQSLNVKKLKAAMASWQALSPDEGWNSLFWGNHDLPRLVSFWGNDKDEQYREKSAQAFAILLHLMRGTPFIYQGEELGMTNYPFENLSQIKDIESQDFAKEKAAEGWSEAQIMAVLNRMSRDQARTPMQWTAEANAGFTSGQPWLPVHPNHEKVNAQASVSADSSVFKTYQQLIQLRHEADWVTEGDFELLETADEIFAYLRVHQGKRYLVLSNLSNQPQTFVSSFTKKSEIISNSKFPSELTEIVMQPWDTYALEVEVV